MCFLKGQQVPVPKKNYWKFYTDSSNGTLATVNDTAQSIRQQQHSLNVRRFYSFFKTLLNFLYKQQFL